MRRLLSTVEKNVQQRRSGAMLVLIAFCLPLILGFGIYAINIAWMQLTRTELRTATDAAVKAGSRVLSLSQSPNTAREWAIEAASRNSVAGTPLTLRPSDVVFGLSEPNASGQYNFTAQLDDSRFLTAVQVTGSRLSGSASGPVPLLFSGFFDRTTFEPQKIAVASQLDRDVAVVLDRSGSMAALSGDGTRWSSLQNAVDGFLDELLRTPQDEQVAICSYSTSASRDEALNYSYEEVRLTVGRLPVGGSTAVGQGVQSGITAVLDPVRSRPLAAKTIIVMTDGNHNRGIDPVDVASAAARDGITVHTITFSVGANQNHMRRVAESGNGRHWHADDEDSLEAVFREVANSLPTLITR